MVFICLSVLIGFVAGCEGQEQMGARKARLLADENRQLRQELAECETQVEEKNQQVEEKKRQVEEKNQQMAELARTRTSAAVREEDAKMITFLSDLLTDFEKKNNALKEENKKLNAKVEELEKQID